MKTLCVAPELLDKIWPHVKYFIKAAHDKTDEGTFAECERKVFNVESLLWIGWDGEKIRGAAVTQICKTEKSKVCRILSAGGTREAADISVIEEYAKREGCDCIRIEGRPGWAKVFPNYKLRAVVLERRLDD